MEGKAADNRDKLLHTVSQITIIFAHLFMRLHCFYISKHTT